MAGFITKKSGGTITRLQRWRQDFFGTMVASWSTGWGFKPTKISVYHCWARSKKYACIDICGRWIPWRNWNKSFSFWKEVTVLSVINALHLTNAFQLLLAQIHSLRCTFYSSTECHNKTIFLKLWKTLFLEKMDVFLTQNLTAIKSPFLKKLHTPWSLLPIKWYWKQVSQKLTLPPFLFLGRWCYQSISSHRTTSTHGR